MGTFDIKELKNIIPDITLATSVKYGNYRHYYDDAISLIGLTIENFADIKKHINLPRKLSIHFRPMRGLCGRAFFSIYKENNRNCRSYTVEVDIRQDVESFKDTLLHELIHIEQFYEKRLIASLGDADFFKWNKERISTITSSREEYDKLPWEREAITRTNKLIKIIFKEK